MKSNEHVLIERVLAEDDRHAFKQLVTLHQSALRIFLRRILGSHDLADDCAQETWLVVYQKLFSLQGGSFRSWLYAIASRRAFRLKKVELRNETLDQEPLYEPDKSGLKLDLDKALLFLSISQRSCLHLSLYEEMSHEEIAEVLNLPLGTVKSHIARGKEKLIQLLSASGAKDE